MPIKGALNAHRRIRIGLGTRDRVSRTGYRYAFANGAWGYYGGLGYYGDSRGSVSLTVTRTA